LKAIKVELLETSEHTVLSRILYPDRGIALLFGKTHHALDGSQKTLDKFVERTTELTIGIATMRRGNQV
jgi:hypothetical protein